MTENHSGKAQLRADLRQRRKNLGAASQLTAAQALINAITDLPTWASARRIALYLAADGEIDTGPLQTLARRLDKELFLPVITADSSLDFAYWDANAVLTPNRYLIPEPPADAVRRPASELDIIFLPVVGWDRLGGRLGMGGGFYDRTLANVSGPLLVGLAHTCQQVAELPLESWDIKLDYVATDTGLNCPGVS